MNEIKKALDSGMKNIHFNEGLITDNKPKYSRMNGILKGNVAAAVAILLIVAYVTGIGQTVLAYTYQSIANIMGLNEAVENYTTVIGSSVTDNRITVTLNDVIVSEKKLIISLNISDGQKMKRDEFGNRISHGYSLNQINVNNSKAGAIKIYMDGKELPIAGLIGTGQDIDDYTMNYITEYYIGHIDWEREHKFKIAMSTIEKPRGGEKCEEINGKWEFVFEASGADMAKDTKVIVLNDVLTYDDGKIIFEKFVANSYEKVLYASTYESSKGKGYDEIGNEINLIGYDDLGNKVCLYAQADYYNKKGAAFICVGGTDISDEASTLTLQAVDKWTDQFNPDKGTITIDIK